MRFLHLSLAVAALAGCGKSNPPPSGTADMAMAATAGDLAMGVTLASTGAPCTKSADCAGTTATCLTKGKDDAGNSFSWPDGYCTSKCSAEQNDPDTGLNPKCPGDNSTCDDTGVCHAACTGVGDCRDKYVCAYLSSEGEAFCYPLAGSGCDPTADPRPSNKKCGNAQKCAAFSPDDSYGQCADVCEPLKQNCAQPETGSLSCLPDLKDSTATGTCIDDSEAKEGDACSFLNDCAPGLMCNVGKCRKFCGTGVNCPNGQTCQDIKQAAFKASVLGICSP